MYLWFITFAIFQLQSYVNAHRDDGENIEKLVYVLNGQNSHGERGGSDTRDIEASRRSVVDKNFMRFGRSKPSQPDDTYDDSDESVIKRTAHENFMRFGRLPTTSTNFMRFGRSHDDSKLLLRPSRYGNKDENFIRFGKRHQDYSQDYDEEIQDLDDYIKAAKGLRFKRSTTEQADDKRSANDNFMRFGRNSNFIRFGRQDFSKCSLYNFHACLQQPQFQLKYPQFPFWLAENQLLQQPMQNFDEKNDKKIDQNLSSNN